MDCLRTFLDSNYDPYAVILQLQHDVEQTGYQLNHAIEVINQQGQVLQQATQYLVKLERKIQELEKYMKESQ